MHARTRCALSNSVADPDPGSGAFLTPGSGIRNRFILGSGIGLFRIPNPRIPNSYFWELSDYYCIWVKSSIILFETGPNFFLQQFKNKIILHFVKFVAKKNIWQKKFFTPLFCSCFWIRDLGSGGSGINIPDPQHYCQRFKGKGGHANFYLKSANSKSGNSLAYSAIENPQTSLLSLSR
jgi:hypothetical protein